jgi:hypothetical protein
VSGGTGTLTNGPTYSTDGGGSIVFDGVDDYVSTLNSTNINSIYSNNQFTLQIWIKYDDSGQYRNIAGVLKNSDFTFFAIGMRVGIFNNLFFDGVFNGSRVTQTIINDISPFRNAWVNVTASYRNGSLKTYFNGVLVLTTSTTGQLDNFTSNSFKIAEQAGYGYFKGNISNFNLYNKQLTDIEILQNYQAQLPTIVGENFITNGLVLYLDAKYKTSYPGTGTTWNNVSGVSGGTGTLTNGPTYDSANGGSIVFDGVDDYVNNGNIPLSSNTFTIEIVFNWDGFNTSTINFLTAGFDEQLEIHTGGASGVNGLRFIPYDFQGSGLQGSIDATNIISSGINHITFTAGYSSPSMAYKNGIFFKSSDTASNVPLSINQTFNIGRRQSNQYFLDGKVYLVKIYNRVLNPSEVLQNFNATKSRFGL